MLLRTVTLSVQAALMAATLRRLASSSPLFVSRLLGFGRGTIFGRFG
jgi:hypothetical protein